MHIVTVGGNIGSGKTTCLEHLESHLDKTMFTVRYEPIRQWHDWLTKFYQNPKKFVFGFQIKVLLSFLYLDKSKSTPHHVFVTERCPLDSLHIFSTNALNARLLEKPEFDIIQELTTKLAWTPHLYIYIRTTPEISLERIKKRGRDCETVVTLKYLQELHILYEHYILHFHENYPSIRTVIIDGDQDISTVQRQVKQLLLSNYLPGSADHNI